MVVVGRPTCSFLLIRSARLSTGTTVHLRWLLHSQLTHVVHDNFNQWCTYRTCYASSSRGSKYCRCGFGLCYNPVLLSKYLGHSKETHNLYKLYRPGYRKYMRWKKQEEEEKNTYPNERRNLALNFYTSFFTITKY